MWPVAPEQKGTQMPALLDVPSYWVIPVSPRLLARIEKMTMWFRQAAPGPSCPGYLPIPRCHPAATVCPTGTPGVRGRAAAHL